LVLFVKELSLGLAGCGLLDGVGDCLTCVATRRGQFWGLLFGLSDFAFPCVFASHTDMMAQFLELRNFLFERWDADQSDSKQEKSEPAPLDPKGAAPGKNRKGWGTGSG
jgi:hypothetical protein